LADNNPFSEEGSVIKVPKFSTKKQLTWGIISDGLFLVVQHMVSEGSENQLNSAKKVKLIFSLIFFLHLTNYNTF
jgi:hypothetical protein